MIYKMHDIRRIAGELIIKDYNADPELHFTNTSFGTPGEVLGSLQAANTKKHYEKTVVYSLTSDWQANKCELKRFQDFRQFEVKEKDVVVQEYVHRENELVMMTFYKLDGHYGDEVYTDDKELADFASGVRRERRKLNYRPSIIPKRYDYNRFTERYDRIFYWLRDTAAPLLKYGTEIYVTVDRGECDRYNFDMHKYDKVKYIDVVVHYIYRNKEKAVRKSHIEYKE